MLLDHDEPYPNLSTSVESMMNGIRPSAFVTGASSGIGLAYAAMLADEGYDLTIVARGRQRLTDAAVSLRARDVHVVVHPADMSAEEDISTAFAAHAESYGRLDVLVNNAGFSQASAAADVTTDLIDAHFALNIRGIILAYREAIPLLSDTAAKQGQAFVFNIASIVALRGTPILSVYAASKAALLSYSQAMHKELTSHGIKSTAICPAYVDTPFSDAAKSQVPAEAMIRPEDLAELTRTILHLSPACHVSELVIERR